MLNPAFNRLHQPARQLLDVADHAQPVALMVFQDFSQLGLQFFSLGLVKTHGHLPSAFLSDNGASTDVGRACASRCSNSLRRSPGGSARRNSERARPSHAVQGPYSGPYFFSSSCRTCWARAGLVPPVEIAI